MKLMNALMSGEHNYQMGKPMPGQIQSSPLPEMGAAPMPGQTPRPDPMKAGFRRERGPLMNALGGFFEFAAPEAYDAGRKRKLARMESDALGAGKYDEAARYRMQAGDFEGGQKIADYGQEQQTASRQQEAQKLVTVLSSAAPEQLNQMAMSDPAGFEQMAGVSSDEYLQSMNRLMQEGGLSLQEAHKFVLTQAQAEAGIEPQGPVEGKPINNRLVDPYTGQVMGDYSDPAKPQESWEDYSPPGAPGGYYVRNTVTGDVKRVAGPDPVTGGDSADYGLNVTWGVDGQGGYVPMQPSKRGTMVRSELPDGVIPLGPYGTAFDRSLGTKAAEVEGDRNPALMGVEAVERDMARLSGQVDLAIGQTNKDNTGFWGQLNITATDLAATLKTIRASGAFTSLVNLKAQGGTLGALSDTELQLLEAKIANVERSQSEEQLDRNLMELKNALQASAIKLREAYEREYAAGRYDISGAKPGGFRFYEAGTGTGVGAGSNAPVGPTTDDLVSMYLPK